jgi:aspartyl-tRNA(Asn)/glutamyl-tRNA(Gln) amidotransferase subunit A
MTENIAFLPAAEAGRRIAARTLSPVALVEAHLANIARHNGQLHIYLTVLAEQALAEARQAEAEIAAGRWRGPLHGTTFAVKDIYFTRGVRTTAGSRIMLDHVPDRTAAAVARLQAAGAILLGKLNTWEYGTGNAYVYHDLPFPVARNPWNPDHFTGGSSTGSGAAIAAGMASFTLGTDTGGSIRLPAAACGVHGLKPTYGRVSCAGILPNCWSLDVAGPLTRTPEDAALALRVLAGHDPADTASSDRPVPDYRAAMDAGLRGLTVGLVEDSGAPDKPDASLAQGLREAAAALEAQGARILPVALPGSVATFRGIMALVNGTESFSIHERDATERPELMGRALREKLMAGGTTRAADYLAAQRQRAVLSAAVERMFGQVDLLLLPGTHQVAPPFADADAVAAFTRESCMSFFSVSGHPAMTVPSGFDAAGLPRNVQMAAGFFNEATLLRAAAALQAHSPWPARLPALAGAEMEDA